MIVLIYLIYPIVTRILAQMPTAPDTCDNVLIVPKKSRKIHAGIAFNLAS